MGKQRADVCTLHNSAASEIICGSLCAAGVQKQNNSLSCRQVLEAIKKFGERSPPPGSEMLEPMAVDIGSRGSITDSFWRLWGGGETRMRAIPATEGIEEAGLIAAPTVLRIFCGDLNCEKSSRSYRLAEEVASRFGLKNVQPDSEATFGNCTESGEAVEYCLTFKPDRARPRVLDYIFADRPAIKATVAPFLNTDVHTKHLFQQVSDHRGVEATFAI